MKELSVEEKAQRYNEALEKARQIHDADRVSGIELTTCEEIFPELKESGDEKVRKFIISIFKDSQRNGVSETIMPEQFDKIFAWLEKQGEHRVSVDDFKANDWYVSKVDGKIDIKERMQPKQYWSEEDIKNINSLIGVLDERMNSSDEGTVVYDYYKSLQVWLESFKDRAQPKQEWSEEDEYHKRQILRILKDNGCSQTLQEKTEKWIEERLKSLRPQNTWKPSDEQMNALEHFIRSIGESGYASPYDNNTKLLYSLFNDLKKLREE